MNNLAGKLAVITGGGQGIGLGISLAMLAAGASILVVQRSPLPAELGDAYWVEADLSQLESFTTIVDAVKQHFGRVDVLVNNAGFMFEKTLDEMDFDDCGQPFCSGIFKQATIAATA